MLKGIIVYVFQNLLFAGKAKRLDWFVGRNKRDRRNDVDVM